MSTRRHTESPHGRPNGGGMIAVSGGAKTCCVCGCQTVSQREHGQASPEQRARWRAVGVRRAAGRGACNTCYVRLRAQGRLAQLGHGAGPGTTCGRCGVTHRRRGGLCDDCRAAVVEAELQKWGAA